MTDPTDVLHGTLNLLILQTLRQGRMHGWGISERIQAVSQNTLKVNQGSLYPALHRMEQSGLLNSSWGRSDNGRRAKFYELTELGRDHLAVERTTWRRFQGAVELVLANG